MKPKPLLILDMDGVLVDVRDSYREVIRKSVILYLKEFIGAEIADESFLKQKDIAEIKRSGGFNNDWDLTYAIINTILKRYFDPQNQALVGAFFKLKKESSDKRLLEEGKKLLKEARKSFIENQLGGTPISKIHFEQKEDSISPFLMNRNDVGSGNLIKRIFQELYLGQSLFQKNYQKEPFFYKDSGYIEHEKLIPSTDQLEKLSDLCVLAIATGRPFSEALYTLKRFEIEGFFPVLVTEDDIQKAQEYTNEQLRKPHPFMIESCMERSGYTKEDAIFYIGDMPDDIQASLRAGVIALGFISACVDIASYESEAHRKVLIDNGAEEVFSDYDELIKYIKNRSYQIKQVDLS